MPSALASPASWRMWVRSWIPPWSPCCSSRWACGCGGGPDTAEGSPLPLPHWWDPRPQRSPIPPTADLQAAGEHGAKAGVNSTYCAPTTCQAALGSSRYQEHQLTALPSRNLLISGRNGQINRPITHLNICNDTGKLQALEEGSLEEAASEMSFKRGLSY